MRNKFDSCKLCNSAEPMPQKKSRKFCWIPCSWNQLEGSSKKGLEITVSIPKKTVGVMGNNGLDPVRIH